IEELGEQAAFWESEVKIREATISELRARIDEQNLIVLATMALGLALGLAGGVVAYKARVERARGVPRRR
ncbi:MAG: hypothetical protein QXF57_02790, partial [Acidilobaceae archaeon]